MHKNLVLKLKNLFFNKKYNSQELRRWKLDMSKNTENVCNNWTEVDLALKKLAELNICKTKLEGEQTLKINEIKEFMGKQILSLKQQIKETERNIEKYAISNKNEFLKKRSKKLNYGTISFKLVKRVCFGCADDVVKALKTLGLDFCVRTKSEPDKEKLLDCDENLLLRAGVTVKKEDKIRIEPRIERTADTDITVG